MKTSSTRRGALETVATVVILWVIVIAGLALAAGYAIGVTPWNAPDEPAHYNYVKYVATTGELPVLKPGDWNSALLDKLKSAKFPPSESIDSIRYESWQPPLFYLLASPIYDATARLPLEQRVDALRLLSVAISGVTVLLIFLAVRKVFPGELPLQLAVAGFAAFLPMRSAIAGSIDNDALAEMVSTLILLQLIWIISSGFGTRRAIFLGITLGAALLTKATIYEFVPLAVVVAALSPLAKGKGGNNRWRLLGITVGVAAVISGWWFIRNAMVYGGVDIFGAARHDQVVVGQPRTGQVNAAALSYLGTTLFKSFWGQFGWMGVLIDERLYFVLEIVTGVAVFGLLLFFWRVVVSKGLLSPQQRAYLALMGAAIVLVLAVLGYYNLTFVQAQGRYLFPAILPIALFLMLGLRELMAPVHMKLLLTLSVGGFALLDFVCLTRYVIPYFR